MKRLVFTFKEDDKVSVDAQGFQGQECVNITEKLLKPLETELTKRELKREYYVTKQETRARVQG
jgi:hypothetical protein